MDICFPSVAGRVANFDVVLKPDSFPCELPEFVLSILRETHREFVILYELFYVLDYLRCLRKFDPKLIEGVRVILDHRDFDDLVLRVIEILFDGFLAEIGCHN